jgi:Ala-tRNA(Pro) deacylase
MAELVTKVETPNPPRDALQALGIDHVTYAHAPVFRVGEDAAFAHLLPGGHTKNLFLKDKKGKIWLVTALADTVIDLKWLTKRLSAASRLSFGSPELLLEVLGVTPGSVTPLSLLNDTQGRATFVLDARMLQCSEINCHPLRNDMTTVLTPQNLVRLAQHAGRDPIVIDFAR